MPENTTTRNDETVTWRGGIPEVTKGNLEVKTDCFAYDSTRRDCSALTDLYCRRGCCNFYKTKEQRIKDREEVETKRKLELFNK